MRKKSEPAPKTRLPILKEWEAEVKFLCPVRGWVVEKVKAVRYAAASYVPQLTKIDMDELTLEAAGEIEEIPDDAK